MHYTFGISCRELFIQINWRFCPETTADEIKERTKAILDRYQLKYDLTWSFSGDPFMTKPQTLVEATQSAVSELTGHTCALSTAGGTSDGRFIAKLGCQVIELGPISATIHKANECVSVTDLDKLALIYERILEKVFL